MGKSTSGGPYPSLIRLLHNRSYWSRLATVVVMGSGSVVVGGTTPVVATSSVVGAANCVDEPDFGSPAEVHEPTSDAITTTTTARTRYPSLSNSRECPTSDDICVRWREGQSPHPALADR